MQKLMHDVVEEIGDSIIQHGKSNDRIYIMKCYENDLNEIKRKIDTLINKNKYSKIVAKVSKDKEKFFYNMGFELEAEIPSFYKGEVDGVFLSKYIDKERKKTQDDNLDKIIEVSLSKNNNAKEVDLTKKYEVKKLEEKDAQEMAKIYKKVFETYPFPIHDKNYLIKTMRDNVIYFGAWDNNKLVGLASSEMSKQDLNSEMTDFAVLEEYRGENIALVLLNTMEKEMKDMGFKTLYTIARAKSYGMNITFSKSGYSYGGQLKNNTNISGDIESMNVWYKLI